MPLGMGLVAIGIVAWLTIGGTPAVSANSAAAHLPAKSISFVASGTGDKQLRPLTMAKKWTVAWNFNCPGATSGKPFSLIAARRGAKASVVASQIGLGGGGNKPYAKVGTYRLDVKTACNWKVTVKSAA